MSLVTLMRLTLLELWRQRIALAPIGILVLLVLFGLLPLPDLQLDDEPVKLAAHDVAGAVFKLLQFFGVVLGLVVGAGLMANEVERGTVLLLATKPVPRWLLVVGKTLGAFAFLLGAFAAWGFVLAVLVGARLEPSGALPTVGGALLGVLPAWLFVVVAMAYSTRLPAIGAMAAGLFTWILASFAPNLVMLKESSQYGWLGQVAEVVTWVLPASQLDALPMAWSFGPALTGNEALGLLAIPAWMLLAVLLFQRRSLS